VAALEALLVGLIVIACAVFSVWRLLSLRFRLKVLDVLSRLPAYAGGQLAVKMRRKALAGLSGGCGSCAAAPPGVKGNVQLLNRKPAAPRR
jgi:hypothetical protein